MIFLLHCWDSQMTWGEQKFHFSSQKGYNFIETSLKRRMKCATSTSRCCPILKPLASITDRSAATPRYMVNYWQSKFKFMHICQNVSRAIALRYILYESWRRKRGEEEEIWYWKRRAKSTLCGLHLLCSRLSRDFEISWAGHVRDVTRATLKSFKSIVWGLEMELMSLHDKWTLCTNIEHW